MPNQSLSPSTLAKKTKQEIIDEYQKLLTNLPAATENAREAHAPENAEVIAKVKDLTLGNLNQSIVDVKAGVNNQLNNLAVKFADQLRALLQQFTDKIEDYENLQAAIAISQKKLQNQYHLEVAAGALENLVTDYNNKQKKLEQELREQKEKLDAELVVQKLAWEREREEYDYNTNLQRQREKEVYIAQRLEQERQLAEREEKIKQQEAEVVGLREQAAKLPDDLKRAAEAREREVREGLKQEQTDLLDRKQQIWNAEKNILEIKIKTLEEQRKEQEADITALKKETELANKKAQELAVKVIESGTAKYWDESKKMESAQS